MTKPVTKPRTTCPDGSPHHYLISSDAIARDGKRVYPSRCVKCHEEREYLTPVYVHEDWNGRLSTSGAGLTRAEYDRSLAQMADERIAS